jgi:predicted RNase H-like HicB family nuclease
MRLTFLIKPVAGHGFQATGAEPFGLTAQGATREEALQNLRQLINGCLAEGAELVSLDVPAAEHPLAPYAGMFKDNPLFDKWQEAIAELRRKEPESPELIAVLRESITSQQQIAQALTNLTTEYTEENRRRQEEHKKWAARLEERQDRWQSITMPPIPWPFKAVWLLVVLTLVLTVVFLTMSLLSQSWGSG